MSFKENFLKKIEINQLAENVIRSLKNQDDIVHIDKPSMRRLLEMASYRYERQRDLDLYIKEAPSTLRVVVLDNELAIYATTVDDVVLRKSPTIKEMVNIRNAIKILNDADVVVSKRAASVAAVQQECADALDLAMNRSDLEAIAEDGRIALEINDGEGTRESLLIFHKLLDFKPPPRSISAAGLEVAGRRATTQSGEILFGPAFIYRSVDNTLQFIEESIKIPKGESSDPIHQLAVGKLKAAAEGSAVFQRLKDMAAEKFFGHK